MAQVTQDREVRSDIRRIRAEIEELREDLDDTLDALGERTSPRRIMERRTERTRHGFRRMRDAVMGPAQSAMSAVQSGAHDVADRTSSAVETAHDAPEMIQQQTRGNPAAAGLVAFGLGLLLGSMFPATEPERQAAEALQDQFEPVKERAMQVAQGMKEDVQADAQENFQQLKSTATDAAQTVKDDAQQAGEHLKEQASGNRDPQQTPRP